MFQSLSNEWIRGYEIHMGESRLLGRSDDEKGLAAYSKGNVFGTYVHGFFDTAQATEKLLMAVYKRTGAPEKEFKLVNYDLLVDEELDNLADTVREALDMERIYGIAGL